MCAQMQEACTTLQRCTVTRHALLTSCKCAGAPLLLGACFMLAAFVIACTVDSKAADHKEEDPHDKGHLQAPLVSPGLAAEPGAPA